MLPVVEEVALRPSRNHHRQDVRTLRLVSGCGSLARYGEQRRSFPTAVAGFRLGGWDFARGRRENAHRSELSCSFQEYELIFLWITGLSVGGL